MKYLIYINKDEKLIRFIQIDDFEISDNFELKITSMKRSEKGVFPPDWNKGKITSKQKTLAKLLKCKEVQFTPQAGGRLAIHDSTVIDSDSHRYLIGRHAHTSLFFDKNYLANFDPKDLYDSIFKNSSKKFIPTITLEELEFLDKKTEKEIKIENQN